MNIPHWFVQSGSIYRSTKTAGVYAAATEIDPALSCSHVIPASQGERERVGLADLITLDTVYVNANTETELRPRRDDRLHLAEVDYRIRAVESWPKTKSQFLVLYIEDEGATV